jgi:transcriptional regulator with XRE-family HTH domain
VKKFARSALLHFGLRVVEERNARGLTQEQLAEKVGISRRHLNRIEGGNVDLGLVRVAEFAHVLKVELSALFSAPAASTARRVGRPGKREE